ncbi:MAG: hypothetical protein K9L68_15110 [Spirochaetales bacterium]|nr:hypothetical protein [Spirochaetales bacterium]
MKNPKRYRGRRPRCVLGLFFLVLAAAASPLSALTIQAEYQPESRRCSAALQDYPALKILENLDRGFTAEITCRLTVRTRKGPFAPVLYQQTVLHQASWDRFRQTYLLTKASSQENSLRIQNPFTLMNAFFSFSPQRLPPEVLTQSRRYPSAEVLLEVTLLPVKLTPPLHILTLFPGTSVTPLTDTAVIPLGDSP